MSDGDEAGVGAVCGGGEPGARRETWRVLKVWVIIEGVSSSV